MNDKVWVVGGEWGEYDDYTEVIAGIFDSKEAAKAYLALKVNDPKYKRSDREYFFWGEFTLNKGD